MIDYSLISANDYIKFKPNTPEQDVLESFLFIHFLLIIILISNYLGNL